MFYSEAFTVDLVHAVYFNIFKDFNFPLFLFNFWSYSSCRERINKF